METVMLRLLTFLFLLLVYTACGTAPVTTASSDQAAVRAVVEQFGASLQQVSLQAPSSTQQLQSVYSPFVDPHLIEQWTANPRIAPGRTVSSPWPDRIAITSITQDNQNQYTVTGNQILITSMEVGTDKVAGTIPVTLLVGKQKSGWKITAYMQSKAKP